MYLEPAVTAASNFALLKLHELFPRIVVLYVKAGWVSVDHDCFGVFVFSVHRQANGWLAD